MVQGFCRKPAKACLKMYLQLWPRDFQDHLSEGGRNEEFSSIALYEVFLHMLIRDECRYLQVLSKQISENHKCARV